MMTKTELHIDSGYGTDYATLLIDFLLYLKVALEFRLNFYCISNRFFLIKLEFGF